MHTTQGNENHDLYNYETANQEYMSLSDEIAATAGVAAHNVSDWWKDTETGLKAKMQDIRHDLDKHNENPSMWDEMKANIKSKMVDLRASYDKAKIEMEKRAG